MTVLWAFSVLSLLAAPSLLLHEAAAAAHGTPLARSRDGRTWERAPHMRPRDHGDQQPLVRMVEPSDVGSPIVVSMGSAFTMVGGASPIKADEETTSPSLLQAAAARTAPLQDARTAGDSRDTGKHIDWCS
jgi:hypothetical protein